MFDEAYYNRNKRPTYAYELLDKENLDRKIKEAQDMEKDKGNKSKEKEIISPMENSK